MQLKKLLILITLFAVITAGIIGQAFNRTTIEGTSMSFGLSATGGIWMMVDYRSFIIPGPKGESFLTFLDAQLALLDTATKTDLWDESIHFVAAFEMASSKRISLSLKLISPGYIIWYIPYTASYIYLRLTKEQIEDVKAAAEKIIAAQRSLSMQREDISAAVLVARNTINN